MSTTLSSPTSSVPVDVIQISSSQQPPHMHLMTQQKSPLIQYHIMSSIECICSTWYLNNHLCAISSSLCKQNNDVLWGGVRTVCLHFSQRSPQSAFWFYSSMSGNLTITTSAKLILYFKLVEHWAKVNSWNDIFKYAGKHAACLCLPDQSFHNWRYCWRQSRTMQVLDESHSIKDPKVQLLLAPSYSTVSVVLSKNIFQWLINTLHLPFPDQKLWQASYMIPLLICFLLPQAHLAPGSPSEIPIRDDMLHCKHPLIFMSGTCSLKWSMEHNTRSSRVSKVLYWQFVSRINYSFIYFKINTASPYQRCQWSCIWVFNMLELVFEHRN